MLTKDDLKAIKDIVDKSIDNAIGDFTKDIFVPFVNYVEKKFNNVEGDIHVLKEDVAVLKEDVAFLKSDVENVERKLDAAFSRDDRQDARIRKIEKKVGLPAFA